MSAKSLRRGALSTVDEEVLCEGQSRLRRWSHEGDGGRVGRQCEVGEDPLDDAGVGDALVARASLVEGRDGADEDAADAGAGGGVVGAEEADAGGRARTHWRTGTSGSTRSTSQTAVSTMRRVPQEGQNPARFNAVPRGWHHREVTITERPA
jgi:hypothetical protein